MLNYQRVDREREMWKTNGSPRMIYKCRVLMVVYRRLFSLAK